MLISRDNFFKEISVERVAVDEHYVKGEYKNGIYEGLRLAEVIAKSLVCLNSEELNLADSPASPVQHAKVKIKNDLDEAAAIGYNGDF